MIAIGSYFIFIMLVLGTVCDYPLISEEENDQFIEAVLQEHNKYRRIHGVHDLVYDNIVEEDFAMQTVVQYANYGLSKAQGFNFGQLKFPVYSTLNSTLAEELVANWYNTGANYDYNNEPTSDKADPFTQIIWQATTELGVSATWQNNIFYVVVSYSVMGNTKGNNEYIDNVKRPLNV